MSTKGRKKIIVDESFIKTVCECLSKLMSVSETAAYMRLPRGTLAALLSRGQSDHDAGKASELATLYMESARAREDGRRRVVGFVYEAATTGTVEEITKVRKKDDGSTETTVIRRQVLHPMVALELLARRFPEEWGRYRGAQPEDPALKPEAQEDPLAQDVADRLPQETRVAIIHALRKTGTNGRAQG